MPVHPRDASSARWNTATSIAAILGYSPKTVRNYVSIILAKLCVDDRARAIVVGRKAGVHRRP